MGVVNYKGHKIQVSVNGFGGFEISYDDKIMDSKSLFAGSAYTFTVEEEGEQVQYEISSKGRMRGFSNYMVIKRNGMILFDGK